MKKIIKIVFVYTGLIIGAGFASGREVFEYFNIYSKTSISGILISAVLFAAISCIILIKASESGISDFKAYVSSVAGKAAPAVLIFMLLYMFCGLFVMFSGSGALIYDMTPFSSFDGAVLMALICFIVLSFDVKGIVVLNTILVPFMIFGILYVSTCVMFFKDITVFSPSYTLTFPMALSAVCYSAYNTVSAGAVLVPLSDGLSRRTVFLSTVISGVLIGGLILVVWLVQNMHTDIVSKSELPMLTLSALCSKTCKRVYSGVLFCAICTTAVSNGFGIMSYFSDKIKTVGQRVLFSAVICLAALPFSLYGFSNAVRNIYSVFGYIGFIWILWIIFDRFKK